MRVREAGERRAVWEPVEAPGTTPTGHTKEHSSPRHDGHRHALDRLSGGPVVSREATALPPDLVLRALADPHRREILRLVRRAELPAGKIAAQFPLTQQAVSQHIGVLKQAGLLSERRDGARRLYRLRHEALEPVRQLLAEFWPEALGRLKIAVEAAHPRPAKGRT